jgi:hypothetical protein
MTTRRIIVAIAAVLLAPAMLVAHHGFDKFDQKHTLMLQGTVKDWQWTNPHTRLVLSVVSLNVVSQNGEQNGKTVEWSLEGVSITQLGHMGWRRDFLKIGDTISVEIFPLRSGKPGGQWNRVYDATGKEIGGSGKLDTSANR